MPSRSSATTSAARATERWLSLGQGIYFLVTALWPLAHMRSFEAATGPKRDHWLVKTVGLTLAVQGAVMAVAGSRDRVSTEVRLLAVGSAAALAAVDVVYSVKRVISPVYLADAVAEAGLIGGWWYTGVGNGSKAEARILGRRRKGPSGVPTIAIISPRNRRAPLRRLNEV